MQLPSPFPITVHTFSSPSAGEQLSAYNRGPTSSSSSRKNALVFIGGLTSGPHTTDLDFLTARLEQFSPSLDYSLWEFRMRSSYSGFGFSSLANDAEDTAALVAYLRGLGREKVVLMGASTGCQDILQYASRRQKDPASYPEVDGYILQSPVSDREAASLFIPQGDLEASISAAREMIERGDKDAVMPSRLIPPIFSTPITAYRWHSLAAKGGDDDFFSSDLPTERITEIFGKVDKPIMILPGEKDEMVPPSVQREELLERWLSACEPGVPCRGLSGFIPGADHVVSQAAAKEWLAERVFEFLSRLGQIQES